MCSALIRAQQQSTWGTGIGNFQWQPCDHATWSSLPASLSLVLAARLLAPASENACIPGNAPEKTTGLPKILAFFWWQIYRNCSENMALVSTRAKRAKNDPEGLAGLAGRQSYDHDSDAATAVPSCASLSLWRLGWSRQPGLGRFCQRPAMWLGPLCRVFPNLGRFAAMPGESCEQKTASFFFFSYWRYTRRIGRLFPFKNAHARY